MKQRFGAAFIIILIIIPVLGYVTIKRYTQEKNSAIAPVSGGNIQIETVKLSNIRKQIPKVREICYFETQKDVDNWAGDGIDAKLSAEQVTQGKYSIKINWDSGNTCRLYSSHFPADWNSYSSFIFDLYSTFNSTSSVKIEVFDNYDVRSLRQPAGRSFLKKYEIKPGWNTITMKFEEIQNNINITSDRKLVHIYFPEINSVYYIDNMRLEQ